MSNLSYSFYNDFVKTKSEF